MDLRYQHVESALAGLYGIPKSEMGAFRARIRHLRNMGVPDVPKVGRGTQITYTRNHLWEMFIALDLTFSGIMPATAVQFVNVVKHLFKIWQNDIDSMSTIRFLLAYHISVFGDNKDSTTYWAQLIPHTMLNESFGGILNIYALGRPWGSIGLIRFSDYIYELESRLP